MFKQMALGAVIKVSTEGSVGVVRALNGQVNTLSSSMMKLTIAAGAMSAVFATGIAEAARYQKMSQEAFALSDDKLNFHKSHEQIRKLSDVTTSSAYDLAEGQRNLAAAGLSGQDAMVALEAAMWGAQAGGASLDYSTDLLLTTMAQFRLPVEKSGHVMDVLAKTANMSNATLQTLGDSLKYAGPNFASMNISLEETAAAIGALHQAGLGSSMGGRGLAAVIGRIAKPSAEAEEAMNSLGVKLVQNEDGSTNLIGTLQSLAAGFRTLGTDSAKITKYGYMLFGRDHKKTGDALVSAITTPNAKDNLLQLMKGMGNVTGEAKSLAELKMNNLIDQFKILKNQIQNVFTFYLLPILDQQLTPALVKLNAIFREIPAGLKAGLGGAMVVMGTLATALTLIGLVATPVIGGLTSIAGFFSAKALAIIAGISAGIVAIVGWVGLLIAAFSKANNFGFMETFAFFIEFANNAWKSFYGSMKRTIPFLKAAFAPLAAAMKGMFRILVNAFEVTGGQEANLARVGQALAWIATGLALIVIGLGYVAAGLLSMAALWFRVVYPAFVTGINWIFDGLDYLRTSSDRLGSALSAAFKEPIAFIETLWSVISALFNNIERVIKSSDFLSGLFGTTTFKEDYIERKKSMLQNMIGRSAAENARNMFLSSLPGMMSRKAVDAMIVADALEKQRKVLGPELQNYVPSLIAQKHEEKTFMGKMEACLNSTLNIDGKAVAQAVSTHEINLAERGGASVTPWQRREVAANGATSRTG